MFIITAVFLLAHAFSTMNVWPSDLALFRFSCTHATKKATVAPPVARLSTKLPERKKKSIDVIFVEVLLRKAEKVNILAWCDVQDTVTLK